MLSDLRQAALRTHKRHVSSRYGCALEDVLPFFVDLDNGVRWIDVGIPSGYRAILSFKDERCREPF